MRATILLVLISSCLVAAASLPAMAEETEGEVFAEVVVSLVEQPQSSTVTAQIDSLWFLVGDERRPVTRSLRLRCRDGHSNWFMTLAPGDSLTLTWEVQREPSRGWIIFGGKGGVARIAVPADGWRRDCDCEDKLGNEVVTIGGVIVDADGQVLEYVECEGDNENVIPRILPLWKGDRAAPPAKLRLLLTLEEA